MCIRDRAIGNPYMIVVPTMGSDMDRKTEQEVFEDSVKVLNQLADIAEPYGAVSYTHLDVYKRQPLRLEYRNVKSMSNPVSRTKDSVF